MTRRCPGGPVGGRCGPYRQRGADAAAKHRGRSLNRAAEGFPAPCPAGERALQRRVAPRSSTCFSATTRSRQKAFIRSASSAPARRSCASATELFVSPVATKVTLTHDAVARLVHALRCVESARCSISPAPSDRSERCTPGSACRGSHLDGSFRLRKPAWRRSSVPLGSPRQAVPAALAAHAAVRQTHDLQENGAAGGVVGYAACR